MMSNNSLPGTLYDRRLHAVAIGREHCRLTADTRKPTLSL